MLTYDDFIERARATPNEAIKPRGSSRMHKPRGLPDDCFWASWITGGAEGGNCWGTGTNHALNPESEPVALHGLVTMMEELDLSLRQALAIQGDIVEGGRDSDRGYYGNFTDYGFKFIRFDDVFERLVEFGCAEERSSAPGA